MKAIKASELKAGMTISDREGCLFQVLAVGAINIEGMQGSFRITADLNNGNVGGHFTAFFKPNQKMFIQAGQ